MGTPPEVTPLQQVQKIGILLGDLRKFNISVLKFLVLQMNMLQQTFEYEFLPIDHEDTFLQKLSYQSSVDREALRQKVGAFRDCYREYLEKEIEGYKVKDKQVPTYHILVTMACFQDGYYSMVENGLVILALGDWKRYMAPPSIVEFILTLIIRHSVSSICTPLRGSVHFGTKGCLFDFTASLDEVRLKVLSGFICSSCRSTLISAGFNQVPEELSRVLKKDWFGKANEPEKPAGIAANLGYDLFTTKGPQPTVWETLKKTLQEEWVKSLLALKWEALQKWLENVRRWTDGARKRMHNASKLHRKRCQLTKERAGALYRVLNAHQMELVRQGVDHWQVRQTIKEEQVRADAEIEEYQQ